MIAHLATLTTAVVSLLTAATLSASKNVERVYLPIFNSDEEGNGYKIQVIGLAVDIQPESRSKDLASWQVKVAIYKKTAADDLVALDAAMVFSQEVVDVLRSAKVVDGKSYTSISNVPAYDPDQLEQFDVFSSIISVNYGARI